MSFQIWDVAGQSGFTNFRHLYLKKAHGVFLVFDLTRIEDTFEKLERWCTDVKEQSPNAKIIVIGNKEDVAKGKLHLTKEEILERFTAKEFFTNSSKTVSKVHDAFDLIVDIIIGE